MNPGSRIRVGLIGCGTIARWQHLRNLRKLGTARIAALADPDSEALALAARRVDARCFRDPDALLASNDVDAVVIASPTGLHASQAAEAWCSGKHVYVEKPLAHDASSLQAVLKRVHGAGPVFAVGYNYRFHPACRWLRRVVDAGAVGDVRAVSTHFTEPVDAGAWPRWRRERALGGGVLLDLGTHHVDLYRWLLRDELIGARVERGAADVARDHAIVRGTTTRGVEVAGYFAHAVSRSHGFIVHGTTGTLQLDLHAGRFVMQRDRRFGYGVATRPVIMNLAGLSWRGRKWIQPSFDPSHGLAIRAFVDAVSNPGRRDADLAGVVDGTAASRIVIDAEAGHR